MAFRGPTRPSRWNGSARRAGDGGEQVAITILCFVIGARVWSAIFALATLAAAPLLLLGPVLDWWRHRRGRRQRHLARPDHFPGG